jgi:hypothetical protein
MIEIVERWERRKNTRLTGAQIEELINNVELAREYLDFYRQRADYWDSFWAGETSADDTDHHTLIDAIARHLIYAGDLPEITNDEMREYKHYGRYTPEEGVRWLLLADLLNRYQEIEVNERI